MAFALAKENERFIARMIRQGRFSNQSEVVREALRRMERQENSYLNPSPLTEDEIKEVYKSNPQEEELERIAVQSASGSLRRQWRKSRRLLENL
jgi:putative addiction module CopG family antidote